MVIPPSEVISANEGMVECRAKVVLLIADPRPWAYSASVRLDGLVDAKGPATIEVRIQVETGAMGVLLLERGSSSVPIVPEQSATRGDPVVLHFEIPAIEEAGNLVFPFLAERERAGEGPYLSDEHLPCRAHRGTRRERVTLPV